MLSIVRVILHNVGLLIVMILTQASPAEAALGLAPVCFTTLTTVDDHNRLSIINGIQKNKGEPAW